MKEHEPEPYEPPTASLPSKRVRGKRWIVSIDGVDREVVLNHSKMGMATTIYIDGELVFKHGDLTTIMPSADIPLKHGASELLITIRDKIIGSEYAIWVNGQLVDGADHSKHSVQHDREKWRMQSALFLVVVAPILYFLLGSEWYVGPIRSDVFSIILFLLGAWGLARHYLFKSTAQ